MGAFQIHTHIDSSRVDSDGQPPWETIELDSYVSLDSILHSSYAETVRFSDFKRRGGESVRYYHLVSFARGLTLSMPASGSGRIISGIYQNRQLVAASEAISLFDLLPSLAFDQARSRLAKAQFLWLNVEGGGQIIYRINCLECFPTSFSMSGSLRLPTPLLKGHEDSVRFGDFANLHLQSSSPLFTPFRASTVDAPVCLQIELLGLMEARLLLQIGGGEQIRLPLDGSPRIIG